MWTWARLPTPWLIGAEPHIESLSPMNQSEFTLAYGCVLVAALMPIACAGIAKWGMFSRRPQQGGYDNASPRAWLAAQTNWRARANAAQANCFEALPFFIGAVLIAQQLQVPQGRLDALAAGFIVLRLGYVAMYLANRPNLRSAVWAAGFAVNVGILLLGWR